MAEQCCKKIRIAGSMMPRYKQCSKKASVEVDGYHYCGIHNPVARKARQEKRDEDADKEHQKRMKTMRLHGAAPLLLSELKHLVSLLGPIEATGTLNVPGLATLNGARAAIAKATGETE